MKHKKPNKNNTDKQCKNELLNFIRKSETLVYFGNYVWNLVYGLFILIMTAVREISGIITENKKIQLY